MRIALCISGQPRFFERGFEYINKHIISCNHNIDIFLHLWFDECNIGKNGYDDTSKTLQNDGYSGDVIKYDTVDILNKLYSPKKILSEPQYDCNLFTKRDYSSRGNLTSPFATFSQYLSSHRCVELKKEHERHVGFNYDVMIKCRYDAILSNDIIISNFNKNVITFHNDIPNMNNRIFLNDGIFFGCNKLMTDMISRCYLKFDDYWVNDNEVTWDNHHLLGKYVMENNIPYDKVYLGDIKWIRK